MIFSELIERYPCLEKCRGEILGAYVLFEKCCDAGGKILCCGNGGSAADCDHFVGELMKGFLKKRPLSAEEKSSFSDSFVADNLQKGLPAISLCAHSALMTAFANDAVPSLAFAQQVYAYAKENGVTVIQAHPYRDGFTTPADVSCIDALEVYNSNPRHENHTEKAIAFAKEHGIPMTAGSDAHRYDDVAQSGVLTSYEIKSAEDYVRCVMSGDLKIIK